MVMEVLVLSVVVVSVQHQHVNLLELVLGNLLISLQLDVRGGGEGCVFSFLLLHGDLLSHGSLPVHLHDNLLKLGVVVLVISGDCG